MVTHLKDVETGGFGGLRGPDDLSGIVRCDLQAEAKGTHELTLSTVHNSYSRGQAGIPEIGLCRPVDRGKTRREDVGRCLTDAGRRCDDAEEIGQP